MNMVDILFARENLICDAVTTAGRENKSGGDRGKERRNECARGHIYGVPSTCSEL